jgi:hypothetical protein
LLYQNLLTVIGAAGISNTYALVESRLGLRVPCAASAKGVVDERIGK